MAELAINRSGAYADYFVVSLDGRPYVVPERGDDLTLRLRGRMPTRYEPGGINAGFGLGVDDEGVLVVERFLLREELAQPGGVLRFEGLVRWAGEVLHAEGALAFGGLEMPAGIIALLGYEGLDAERRRELSAMSSPPLGTLRMW